MLDIYQILYKTCFISYPPLRISTTIAHFAQLSTAKEAKLIDFFVAARCRSAGFEAMIATLDWDEALKRKVEYI